MATLPWTPTDHATPAQVVILGSKLELRSYRHIPAFLRDALRIRKQVRNSPGAIGVSLIAQPLHKRFWTLSAWTDESAIDAFVVTEPHLGVMRRYHGRLGGAAFETWALDAHELPKPYSNAKGLWRAAFAHLGRTKEGANA